MLTSEKIVGVLSIIALLGVIFLVYVGKEVGVLLPVLTALVAYLVGKKEAAILGSVKKSLGYFKTK